MKKDFRDILGFARITISDIDKLSLFDYLEIQKQLDETVVAVDGIRVAVDEFMIRESDLSIVANKLKGFDNIYVGGYSENICTTYLSDYQF